MMIWLPRFNIYLALAAVLALLCGCHSDGKKQSAGAVRIHIQTTPDTAGMSQQVSVVRADPVVITIARQAILTEADLTSAKIVEVPGGFAIALQFNETGAWTLEQFSAANPGGHFVIFGQWGEKLVNGRWLAAPIITKRISNGALVFTPDASREEASLLVLGLNSAIKDIHKGDLK
jgi:preprotein translocase subunit SecD